MKAALLYPIEQRLEERQTVISQLDDIITKNKALQEQRAEDQKMRVRASRGI